MGGQANGETRASGAGRGAAGRRRVKPRAPAGGEAAPSHADILDAVARLGARQDASEVHRDLMAGTMQRIETALTNGLAGLHDEVAGLRASIGREGEDEYGKPIGTGVVGRLMRLERRFGRYDGWVKWARGAAAVAGVAGIVLWWAWGPKLEAFFR